MLVSQSTTTRGLISAILGNAEIASLGRAPGMRRTQRLSEMADARTWFLNAGNRFPGETIGDDLYAGYESLFCIKWLFNNPKAYMNELVNEWKKSDPEIIRMIRQVKFDYLSFQNGRKYKRSMKSLRKPDKNTLQVCSRALDVIHQCKELYYG